MADSALTTKLGTDFIANLLSYYRIDTTALNSIISAMQKMPNLAQSAFVSAFEGRASLNSLIEGSTAHHKLNEKTWHLLALKLEGLGAAHAASALRDMNRSEAFHKPEITEQLIHEVIEKLS